VSCLLAGTTLLVGGHVLAAAPLLVGGVVSEVASILGARHAASEGRVARFAAWAVAVEVASVATIVLRLALLLAAVRVPAGLAEPLVLAVAIALAAALGVFPGGLGVREGLSAALAPLVGLPMSVGFLVAALNRAIGLVVLAPLAAGVELVERRSGGGVDKVRASSSAPGTRTSEAEEPSAAS